LAAALRRIGDEYHGNFSFCEAYQFAAIKTGAKRSEQQFPWLSCNRGVRRHADLKCNLVLTERVMRQNPRTQVQSLFGGELMMYRLAVWSMIIWIAVYCAPYVYALNDLVTWW
jgi:hypothetical protein